MLPRQGTCTLAEPSRERNDGVDAGAFGPSHAPGWEVDVMTTMTQKPREEHQDLRRYGVLLLPELWGAVAIAFIWLAVLFDGIYGADVTSFDAGAQATTIPSAVFVALFACIATTSVAKRAFRHEK
jgi:hypothetical protein